MIVLSGADSVSLATSATVTGGNMVSLLVTGAKGHIGVQMSDARNPSAIVPAMPFSFVGEVEAEVAGKDISVQTPVPYVCWASWIQKT